MSDIDKRLAEIEARAEKATDGPWDTPDAGNPPSGLDETFVVLHEDGGDGWRLICQPETMEDAQFIAHSREDVPWLVAELRRARVQLDRAFLALNWADRSQYVFDEDRAKFNELFGAACVEDDAAKGAKS